jgi:hypothetical protein
MLMNSLRTFHPVNADGLVTVLRDHCGWAITSPAKGEIKNGAQLGTTTARDGRHFPIIASCVAYVPGDEDDEEVAILRQAIEEHGENGVIVFNRPFISQAGEDKTGGTLMQGGLILDRGQWRDFMHTPGGNGIDDTLEHGTAETKKAYQALRARFGLPTAQVMEIVEALKATAHFDKLFGSDI